MQVNDKLTYTYIKFKQIGFSEACINASLYAEMRS